MQVGSIRGHGNYVAADWTADCLHREAMFTLEKSATAEFSKIDDGFDPPEDDAAIA
jgi:nitric oxide reductase large subunit